MRQSIIVINLSIVIHYAIDPFNLLHKTIDCMDSTIDCHQGKHEKFKQDN